MDSLDKTLPKDLQNVVIKIQSTKASEDGSNSSSVEKETNSESGELAGVTNLNESSYSAPTEQSKNTQEKQAMENAMSKEDIRQVVADLLTEKDAQASVEAKFAALEDEKAELAQKLSEAKEATDTLSDKLEVTEKAIADSKAQVDALEQQKEELVTKASALEEELGGIKAQQVRASRTEELSKAGVLLDGEKGEKQIERIVAMSDEAFSTYRDELAEIVVANKKTNENKGTGETPEEIEAAKAEAAKAEAAKAEEEGEPTGKTVASEVPAPADLNAGEAYHQALAAISGEINTDESMVSTYASM